MIKIPKILTKSELARAIRILPQNLNNKLNSNGGHRLTPSDVDAMITAVEYAIKELEEIKAKLINDQPKG